MSTSIGTPTPNSASELLRKLGIPQADLRRATGLSRSTISRLCARGEWPAFNADPARNAIEDYLARRGLTVEQRQEVMQALQKKSAPSISYTDGA
ncbi:MAG: hypothetical protein PHH58_03150, partial [Rhodoferax sp.]|nr:hypothetical protein [Rhodoferax sp.]